MSINDQRILLVKPSSLGDVVHTLPLAHSLKRCFPDCRLGWIVQESFADLLRCDPAIDTVYPINIASTSDPRAGKLAWVQAGRQTAATLRQLRSVLRRQPYDIVLDLHASFRSGLLGRTNPGGVRIGFQDARELNTLFQDQLVAVPAQIEHAVEKNLLFCDLLGCRSTAEDFHMCCSNGDKLRVRDVLERCEIPNAEVLLYANPAARWQTKFWPTDNWAELADRLAARGVAMVFGGSAQDREYIRTITEKMETSPRVAAGDLSLTGTVALLQRSSLYVGLDSGPMHMAAMCGVPVVALFGPTHPSRVGPYGVRHKIVRSEELACLECRKRSCDHHSCMKDISVQMVEQAVLSLLNPKTELVANEDQPYYHNL